MKRSWDCKMKASYKYFENRDCEYYPCHKGIEEFNCLFCYCPFYRIEDCPGHPAWIERGDARIKNCTGCTFPHRAENYEAVIEKLKNL